MNRLRFLPLVPAIGCLLALSCGDGEPAGDRAIFLIVVDTLRADRLSSYGYAEHQTPGIDRIASLGVRFENANSSSSWTIPSMASLMTSRYPSELGLVEAPADPGQRFEVRERRRQRAQTPPLAVETLAEVMAGAGYRTGAFVNQPGLNTGIGFTQGFADWFYTPKKGRVERHDPSQPLAARGWGNSLRNTQISDRALVERFDVWLAEHGESKIFAWVHLLTPHTPYDSPVARQKGEGRIARRSRRYDYEVREVDAMVADLVASIEAHVGLSRAAIVFTSDHGEAFGEHGMEEHGHSLHREVMRIPLIVASPRFSGGGRFAGHVSLVDIMPTILDLAGLDHATPPGLRGESLASVLDAGARSQPIYSEGMLYGSSERSYIEGDFKLMVDEAADAPQLFALTRDPDETDDVAARQTRRRLQMATAMETLRADLARSRAALPRDSEADGVDEDAMIEALQALGYVE
jgi:choline-sulfatase